MAFQKFDGAGREGGFKREMIDVKDMNIKCKDCGAEITELPFQPDPNRLDSIRCRECLKKFRDSRPRRF